MKALLNYCRELGQAIPRSWNRFWFTPADPATLSLIRICAGAMLFYTHLVWGRGLEDFFGPQGWLEPRAVALFNEGGYTWSHFWLSSSGSVLWATHVAALAVFALLTVGLYSRVMSAAALFFTLSYVHRVPGALFGLDQINAALALYLAVGPCGACYSVDALLRRRAGERPINSSVSANVAIRLLQLHMCVMYLFAGLSKLAGPAWWNGTALWGAFGNLEYQSLDMLWMANYPRLINALTLVTLAWEISYCFAVWPRLCRPIVITLAVPLHMGIAVCLGMITFGLAMLIGNLAFVAPALVRSLVDRRQPPRALPRTPAAPPAAPRARRPGSPPRAEGGQTVAVVSAG